MSRRYCLEGRRTVNAYQPATRVLKYTHPRGYRGSWKCKSIIVDSGMFWTTIII